MRDVRPFALLHGFSTVLRCGLVVLIGLAGCTDNLVTPQDGPRASFVGATEPPNGLVTGPPVAEGPPVLVGAVTITWGASAPNVVTPPVTVGIGTDGTLTINTDGTLSVTPPSDITTAAVYEFQYEFTNGAQNVVTRVGTVETTVGSIPTVPATPILVTLAYVPGSGNDRTTFDLAQMATIGPMGVFDVDGGGVPVVTPPDDFHEGGSFQYTLNDWMGPLRVADLIVRTGCTPVLPGDPVTGLCEYDFGDAPDNPYPTLLSSDGARHLLGSGLSLGATVDHDPDGQPNSGPNGATGDDLQTLDDEDGVTFASAIVPDADATVDVVASASGMLNAWIDFNGNGVWEQGAPEQIAGDVQLSEGTNEITFGVPAAAVFGKQYARFRVNSAGGLGPTGEASDGEVEDYLVTIVNEPMIVFESERDGNLEIYLMNADGSNQINLSNHSGADNEPEWSPDGSKITFVSTRDGNKEVYVVNVDGTGLTNVTNHAEEDDLPLWSPDGSKILFRRTVPGQGAGIRDLYVVNATGTGLTNLTNDPSLYGKHPWSPDGSQVSFGSDLSGQWEIHVMDDDGSNLINLTQNTGAGGAANAARHPDWSPDATQITMVRGPEIYVIDTDGSGLTNLTNGAAPAFHDIPRWSPNGTRIAFGSPDGIHIVDPVGGTLTNLTDDTGASDRFPHWSPDGMRIAFRSNRDGNYEIYVMDADGQNLTRLTNTAAEEDQPRWRP